MADIKIDVGNAQLAASGSQDLTISGFGTAKAILGFVVNATADDTLSNDAAIAAFWADDSGAAGSCGIASENGVTTTATYRDAEMPNGDLRLNVAGAGTISLNASARIDSDDATAGPITNGWRIGIDIGTTAVRIVFILFGGADLSAAAWSGNAGDTISVGFESDLILGFGVGNHSGGPYSNAIMSLGASD